MLRELHVKNLAVLAEASVVFGPGLNVLSGETGAGKSIVVDSLFLLAGQRASGDLVRSGAETLTVTGIFAPAGAEWRAVLGAAGIETEDGEVLVRREIGRNGRNRVFVNDQPTTLRLLADLAPSLLRIHGQRDELDLIVTDLQRAWLDQSGGAEAEALLAATAEAFAQHERLAERLERLTGDDRVRRERIDLLRFHAAEIDAAHLRAGEDDALRAERETLRHTEAISHALGTAFALLSEEEGSTVERVARSEALLSEVAEWEPQAAVWSGELAELRIGLGELARSVRGRLDHLEADPRRLDAVEERLALLERLARRHGGSAAAVLARREEIESELAELLGDAMGQEELTAKVERALAEYRSLALLLSAGRERWGKALASGIEAELQDLGLARARLSVLLERRRRADSPLTVDGQPVELGRHGIDQVVFLFAPNPGLEARPLARIASGGELSRLHLGLQLAAHGDRDAARPTLVFDEVDSGVGGVEAAALGRKLKRLARGGQILAVTHLPQVASQADLHFKVSKRVAGERTHVQVAELSAEARVEEVARMLAGDALTPLSLSHARELIAGAAAPERRSPRARK